MRYLAALAAVLFLAVAAVPITAQEAPTADQTLQEAIQKRNTGDATAALPLFEKAAVLFREAENSKGEAVALKEMGNTYEGLGEHRQAIERERQTLEIAERIHDGDLQARALVNLGISLQSLGQNEQALDYYEKSLAISRADGNDAAAAVALWAKGSLLAGQGKNAEAVTSLKAAVAAAQKADDKQREDLALVYLGRVYSNLEQRKESIDSYRAALDLARLLRNPSGEATILSSVASEYLASGELDKATDLSKEALAIGRASGNQGARNAALQTLSAIYLRRSEFQNLLDTSQQLRALAQETTDFALEEMAVLNLALAYTHLDGTEMAVAAYRDLLALARRNGNGKDVEKALQALGDDASLREDHQEALRLYGELLTQARELSDPARVALALVALGTEYEALAKGDEAMSAFAQALKIAEDANAKLAQASALRKLGIALLSRNQLLEGADLLDQGCTLTQELLTAWKQDGLLQNREGSYKALQESLNSITTYLHRVAETLYAEGVPKPDEAQEKKTGTPLPILLEHALARARKRQERLPEAHILILLGEISLRSGDAAKAIDYSSQALKLSPALMADDVEERALTALSNAYTIQKDFAASIRYEQELLSLAQRRSEPKLKATALSMLANDYLDQGNLEKAITLGEEARAAAVEQHLEPIESLALGVLMTASSARLDNPAAIRWSEEALRLAQRMVDPKAEAVALTTLGDCHLDQGDYGHAIKVCNQGLSKATGAVEVSFLLCLGTAYDALQDDQKAGELLEKALRKVRELKDPVREADVLARLGQHHLLRGESPAAAERFEQSARLLLVSHEPFAQATAEVSLASAQILRGEPRNAISHYERSLGLLGTLRDPRFAALSSELKARVVSLLVSTYALLGEADKGLSYAEREWESQKHNPQPISRALALHDLGTAHWLKGNLEPAAEAARRAITEWEAARNGLAADAQVNKAALLDSQGETYELLQRILVTQKKPEAALEIAERGRARAFIEAMSARAGDAQPAPLDIEAISKFAKERLVTLIEYSILYDPAGLRLPSRVRGGQPQLEKDLFVWAVKSSGEIVFRRVDLKAFHVQTGSSLAETVRAFRGSVGGRGRGQQLLAISDANEPLRRLYDLLIAPIAEHLPPDPEARIVFVPQGPLFLVPFSALRAPSGRYLLEDHTVLSAPSIGSQASIPRHPLLANWKAGEVLVAGDPTIAAELKLEPYGLADLPESGKEAIAIAASFGTEPLVGYAATKDAILPLLSQRRLLHLATHGLLESGFGDSLIPGTLVLAPGKTDDGLLTAREILDMNLHADLAVLSACDTGGGRITSDGVIGLSRAFLSAGVPNLMVSLWQIPDAPTSGLMQRFYGELKANPDPGRALRQAMLATMKDHPRPEDWAGFTLIGGLQ